jgi:poly [ADP-ribose] polymerase 6/8
MCRCGLPPGANPPVCGNTNCQSLLTQIGIGAFIAQEIKRDPMAADFAFSIFSAAIGTNFLNPAPPDFTPQRMLELVAAMPAMSEIVQKCQTDQQLVQLIGADGYRLLRWVLLSNQSHLISLPDALRLQEFPCQCQFMTLLSSPSAETTLCQLKDKYGGMYLWHGSAGSRWYSILRNGLKNASGSTLQANGASFGPGIYFGKASSLSWGYSRAEPNKYQKSALGGNLQIISLCEVAKVTNQGLKDFSSLMTLTMEQACIVRFLMVQGSFNHDVTSQPPRKVPTLNDVLEYQAGTIG